MYDSILVPLDFGAADDRVLAVAGVLARAGGLPVHLVVVASPGWDNADDKAVLDGRAGLLGDVPWTSEVRGSDDVAATLLEVLAERPGALPVLATHARGPLARRVMGSVSEALVSEAARPLLMVGPNVTAPPQPPLVLVVATDHDQIPDDARGPVQEWEQTFHSGVGVVHAAIDAPVRSVLDDVAPVPGHVLAAPTWDWPKESGAFWGSTTRALVHEADCPVLVIPQVDRADARRPG